MTLTRQKFSRPEALFHSFVALNEVTQLSYHSNAKRKVPRSELRKSQTAQKSEKNKQSVK